MLIFVAFLNHSQIVAAQNSATAMNVSSYGTIKYSPTPSPTPIPTPNPIQGNIAVTPSFWSDPIGWSIDGTYTTYPVSWQGQTCIKMSRNPVYVNFMQPKPGWVGTSELNGRQTSIKGGDHVIYKAWIWVEPSTTGCTQGGCYMGIDAYTAGGSRIQEIVYTGNGINVDGWEARLYVPFGSTGWTQLTMDFIMHSTYDGQTVALMVPWFQVVPDINNPHWNEESSSYIYGTELYVNP